ncbi:MAG: E3 binding domain-containing protein [Acidobacteriia bacterium]|nr:E3 binding domain-containing protein [Terriglobia bacterium]
MQQGARQLRLTPKARRLAKERNISLTRWLGSCPNGEFLAADILSAATVSGPVLGAPSSRVRIAASPLRAPSFP